MQFSSNCTGVNEIIILESAMVTGIISLLLAAYVQVISFLAMKMNKEEEGASLENCILLSWSLCSLKQKMKRISHRYRKQ